MNEIDYAWQKVCMRACIHVCDAALQCNVCNVCIDFDACHVDGTVMYVCNVCNPCSAFAVCLYVM